MAETIIALHDNTLKVVDDAEGTVCIGLSDPLVANNPALVFIDIIKLAKDHPIALRGSEATALAFMLGTSGRGLLWFVGKFDA